MATLEPINMEQDDLSSLYGDARMIKDLMTPLHGIRPRLFIGSLRAAKDDAKLHVNGITHVVNCLSEDEALFKEFFPPPPDGVVGMQTGPVPEVITYLTLDLGDIPEQRIDDILPGVCEWMDTMLAAQPHHGVLVHCAAGASRSGAVMVAYLMHAEGLTAARALLEVQRIRSCVDPNEGFRRQLLEWEHALASKRSAQGLLPLRTAHEFSAPPAPQQK